MKFQLKQLALAICILCSSCATTRLNTASTGVLTANQLAPYGRFIVDAEQNVSLISSAVHVGVSFEGRECQVFATLPKGFNHNFLQYELDGVYQKRIRIEGDATQPIVLTAGSDGNHTVWIYKATEAHSGAILIQKITGKGIKPLQRPAAPLIEFIGNSITCGAAADASEVPCGTGDYHDHHNAYYAYGPRVARELKTNFIVSSVSGIGVYRNWNSDGPAMPAVYEKTDFHEASPAWNFSLYTPQIVSIALGTNDFSNGDGKRKRLPFDSAAFVGQYTSFVNLVKSKYPNAQIVLLSSPMVNGAARVQLQNYLSAVKKNIDAAHSTDKPVAVFFFEPMQARGCSGHPSVEDHAILAKELTPFFQGLLQQ